MDQEEWVFKEPKDGFSVRRDMRESGVSCDVIICVGNERLEAHRAVLGTMIPYFQAMFAHGMIESRQKEIRMENVDPLALRKLIDFTYMDEISISKQNMLSLVQTSTYLQLDSVTDACCKFMLQNVNVKNAAAILECAQLANYEYGIVKAHRYIRVNFEKFLKSEEFLSIPYHMLKELIARDDLLVTSEKVIFEGVMTWLKAEEGNRQQYLQDLLKLVRMPLLNLEYLNEKVCTELLIQQSQCCQDLVRAAITCHMEPEMRSMSSIFTMNERQWEEKLYSVKENALFKSYISLYEPSNRRWHNFLDLPRNQSPVQKVIFGNDQIHIFRCTSVSSLNAKTLQMTENTLPKCPCKAGMTSHHNQIYFFGRQEASMAKKIFTYTPETGTYEEVGEMLKRRSCPNALSLGENIYIFGGCNQGYVLKTMERYDPVQNECTRRATMLTKTTDFDVTALNDKIYLYGQCMDTDLQDTCTLDVYDPITNQWNLMKRFINTRRCASLVTYTNRLVITDKVSSGNIYLMDTYDPTEDEWKTIFSTVPCSIPTVPMRHHNGTIST